MLRKLAYLALIAFFAAAAFLTYSVTVGLNQASRVVSAPVQSLARQLSLEATPVVLPDPVTIVREVNTLARLETASLSMEKVITASDNGEQLFGLFEDEMIFVAYGHAEAGVDLARLQPSDIAVVDPTTVMIYLPPAEIFSVYLDEELSYVADRDTRLLARTFNTIDPDLETVVRRAAVDEIERAAEESSLVSMADDNARDYLRQFLEALGFEEVIFTESPPTGVAPYEQSVPKGWELSTPEP